MLSMVRMMSFRTLAIEIRVSSPTVREGLRIVSKPSLTVGLLTRFVVCQLVLLCLISVCVPVFGQSYQDFTTGAPLPDNQVLILGLLGGREPWDNPHRNVRKLALKLRAQYPDKVQVETLENTKRRLALELIRRAFDRNGDGSLDAQERAGVRLIIYGQSFGGAAVVKLARQLKELGVPVLLTVQVDSVGRGDGTIPANVTRAANLFQRNGRLIRVNPKSARKTRRAPRSSAISSSTTGIRRLICLRSRG